MASRPRGYGLAADEKRKIDAKYSLDEENNCRQWMEAVIQEPLVPGASAAPLGMDEFKCALHDGVFLCKLLKKLNPSFRLPRQGGQAFQQMAAIEEFLKGCKDYGVETGDLFQVVDLYESGNMSQVLCTISALGRKAQTKGFDGPVLGPRESTENVREFTEEQLKEGEKIIGLQMGTNKYANQAGMIMGKNRQIID